jgi:hypothetical protein
MFAKSSRNFFTSAERCFNAAMQYLDVQYKHPRLSSSHFAHAFSNVFQDLLNRVLAFAPAALPGRRDTSFPMGQSKRDKKRLSA